jgi:hypothetical protein
VRVPAVSATIKVFHADGWGGVYVDGVLVAQGHNSDAERQALELAGVETSWPPEFQEAVDAAGECPPRWPL